MMMRGLIFGALAASVAVSLPLTGSAATFVADLMPLNASGVTGRTTLDLNDAGDRLKVKVRASGLTPGQSHPQHIHGAFDSNSMPINSTVPTMAQDTDGDGFIEVLEGMVTYGPIILPLNDKNGMFPVANDKGKIKFKQTYNLNDSSVFTPGFTRDDLTPLTLREIVLHGRNVPAGAGAGTMGEVNGVGGYIPVLPVAAAEIAPIPLPAAGWLLIGGIATMFGFGRRRRAAA